MKRARHRPSQGPSREDAERVAEILNRYDLGEIRGIVNSVLDAADRGGAGLAETMVVSALLGMWHTERAGYSNFKKSAEPYLRGRQNLEQTRSRETRIRHPSGKTIVRKPIREDDLLRVSDLSRELAPRARSKSDLYRRIARRLGLPSDDAGMRRVRTLRDSAAKAGYLIT